MGKRSSGESGRSSREKLSGRPEGVPPDGFSGFMEGVRVRHPMYGPGTVIGVSHHAGGDREIVVRCDYGRSHRLLASLARLQLIRRGERDATPYDPQAV